VIEIAFFLKTLDSMSGFQPGKYFTSWGRPLKAAFW